MHISTRLLFLGNTTPPRNPIIVTVTSPRSYGETPVRENAVASDTMDSVSHPYDAPVSQTRRAYAPA